MFTLECTYIYHQGAVEWIVLWQACGQKSPHTDYIGIDLSQIH